MMTKAKKIVRITLMNSLRKFRNLNIGTIILNQMSNII